MPRSRELALSQPDFFLPTEKIDGQARLRIRVDRKPVALPDYAGKLSLYQFWNHLRNTLSWAKQVSTIGYWMVSSGDTDNLNPKIMNSLLHDPKVWDYFLAFLRHGPDETRPGNFGDHSYATCASELADLLAQRKISLEITPHREYEYWGVFLNKGSIIVRGDAKSVKSLGEAGLIFIDGKIELVDSPALTGEGTVYATGNIAKLYDPSYMTVVAPQGIDQYKMERRHASGKIKAIPPFIFTTQPVTGTRIGYEDRNYRDEFAGSHVFPAERIAGWQPWETREKAFALCQEILEEEFRSRVKAVTAPKEITRIAEMLFEQPDPPRYNHNYPDDD